MKKKQIDYLLPRVCIVTFISMVILFACSILKTGGGLLVQFEDVRYDISELQQNQSLTLSISEDFKRFVFDELKSVHEGTETIRQMVITHAHERSQKDKAVFPIKTEVNENGEMIYYY